MRFLSFSVDNRDSWGVAGDLGVVDLGARLGGSLQQALARRTLAEAADKAAKLPADFGFDDIRYRPPVTQPEKIICIGVNYANRNAEYKDGSEAPAYPSVFLRAPDSVTGHGEDLLRPPESLQLDYEGEIALVIGKSGRRIPRERAHEHIAGLTIMNEGTLRDWVRHAKFNVTQGKNFFHSGAIGPWLVSADEFSADDYRDMRVQTFVNDELRQNDTTASMMFPIDYLIAYLSTFFVLKPGDIIATGTPNGAGARFDPPRYLVPGDRVVVEVEGIGRLSNGIRDEEPSS